LADSVPGSARGGAGAGVSAPWLCAADHPRRRERVEHTAGHGVRAIFVGLRAGEAGDGERHARLGDGGRDAGVRGAGVCEVGQGDGEGGRVQLRRGAAGASERAQGRELQGSAGSARTVIDQYLRETVAGVDLDLLLEVAYHCISLNPLDRPQMNKVVETLEILSESGFSPDGTSARTSQADPSKPRASSDIPGFRPVGSYFIFDT
jgi:hypothetical protein